ncbi:hypothetical protein GW943_02805 [Candidatus Parcubacteria bacterium]|uniref:Type IV secretion system protein n=1 Tax=Candidatus Kaiserbacteria bacterium CG10_big_fil_rev_8_21_14_0_10_47_16 TaxID=1974608 RepID=A0A2H0UFZ7_9BACT|nr:hypothetical protein [Candidatus Parcubacteria bacterium]PIR84606.1 MAG: hypothetical protein COU16_03470 [Candidatus Kaiserbacteria bacterium CG10_big_fil_rev_8_21_14_0_10_47_16]
MFSFAHNKKHLLIAALFVCSLAFTALSAPQYAHAQTPAAQPAATTGTAATPTATAPAAATTESPKETGGGVGSFLGNLVLSLGGAIAGLGGWLLDGAIDKFVIHIADGLHANEPLGKAISTLWTVVRDIVNLVFIFGFVYIGIRTIIDPSRAQTKSFLSQLVVAALLVNFSLFFVKFVIDIANVTSLEIYNLIGGGQGNIAAQFAAHVGVPDWFTAKDPEQLAQLSGETALVYYIMAALFLIIAGFTFAAGAFLLVSRYIVLILLMIFSPLIFAAMVFPQLGKIGGGLMGRLINYAFMAPAYLFLLYLSLSVVVAASPSKATSIRDVFAGGINGSSTNGDISIILVFFIGIGLLIASLQAAKALGVAGSQQTLKFGNYLRGQAQSFVGRNTVGRAGDMALKAYEKVDAKATSSKTGRFLRGAVSVASVGVLSDRSVRTGLQKTSGAKFGGTTSFTDAKKYDEDLSKRRSGLRAEMQREKDIEKGIGLANTDLSKLSEDEKKVHSEDMQKMVDAIEDLTADQMKDLELNILTNEDVAVHLSMKQIEGLEKTGKYSDAQIESIKDAKKAGTRAIALNTNGRGEMKVGGRTQQERLVKQNVNDVGALHVSIFKARDMARYLTPAMVEARMQRGITEQDLFDPNEKDPDQVGIRQSLNTYLNDTDTPQSVIQQWAKWKEKSPVYAARLNLDIPDSSTNN